MDTSGSMHGTKIEQAKETLIELINLNDENVSSLIINISWYKLLYLKSKQLKTLLTKIPSIYINNN